MGEPSELERERAGLLAAVQRGLELPMAILGFAWLALLVLEWTQGLSPFLSQLVLAIWGAFIAQFLLEFWVAPQKKAYLRGNLLTIVSLALPAMRVFRAVRIVRFARATGGVRLLRLFTSLNRGVGSLGGVLQKRGFGYVLALTVLVVFAGGAGMMHFENTTGSRSFEDYGEAVWWTAMVITTMGTDYFPNTAEGRLLCFVLAVYGFAMFGYVTATVASFFVGQDWHRPGAGSFESRLGAIERSLGELLERRADEESKRGKPEE